MKKRYTILIASIALLLLVVGLLIIKNINSNKHKLPPPTGEIIDLGEVSYHGQLVILDQIWTVDEYHEYIGDISIIGEWVDGQLVEVVDLGDIGILGSKLSVDNATSEFTIDPDKLQESLVAGLEGGAYDDPTTDPGDDNSDDNSDNGQTVDNPDNNTGTDNITNPMPDDPQQYRPAVTEFVSGANSRQNLGYVVYAPENANANTPIFLFMHGVGENGASYDKFIGTFGFLKYLINGQWQPNFIVVAPIMERGSSWVNQAGSVQSLLGEVIDNYGGNWDSLYVGGFSAGSDAITPLAQSIHFQGAIYMAGYMGGVNNTTDAYTVMNMWSGRNVFYFRDSLYKGGGYGYQSDYVNTVASIAPNYNVNFIKVDMNWGHYSAMVDAAFLPSYFRDSQGQYCHDAISDLIY